MAIHLQRYIKSIAGWSWMLGCSFLFCLLLSVESRSENSDLISHPQDNQLIDIKSEKYQKLFNELIHQYGFSQKELDSLFRGVAIKRSVLDLMEKPGEAKPYYQYRQLFITPLVIYAAKAKMAEYKNVLDRIETELGVNREFVVAIWAIESRFGQRSGQYSVFQCLNTLFDAYPRRSDFFRDELLQFLVLCKEHHLNPLTVHGSYAGAFGQTQFMPSSYRKYAISFDGDDTPDVFNSVPDVLASIANYLRSFHWVLNAPVYADIGSTLVSAEANAVYNQGRTGRIKWQNLAQSQGVEIPRPPGDRELSIIGLEIHPNQGGGFRYLAGYPNFQAITAWNNSNRYAMAVSQLAEAIR